MAEKEEKMLIGWACKDITPDKPAILVGQFHVRISEYVNDPLTVTSLALQSEENNQQAVIVSIDAASAPDLLRDKCRGILKNKIPEFNPSNLFLSATHTHSAPTAASLHYPAQMPEIMSSQEYLEFLAERVSDAVAEAWNNKKQGFFSWGCGQAVVGFNRRQVFLDGSAEMYGDTNHQQFSHIEGHEDHGVDFLFTYDENKKLTGMIVNLACPSQVTENSDFVSADFWHEARTEIRRRQGENLYILPQCSAAGDQSPHLMLKKKAESRMLNLKGWGDGGESERSSLKMQMALRREIGSRIADAADKVIPLVSSDIRQKVIFKHSTVGIDLPGRMVTEAEKEMALKQVDEHKKSLKECEQDPADRKYSRNYTRIRYFQEVIDRFDRQKEKKALPVEIHIIRLGDIAFATNRFELFLDFGQRIKARSNAVQTFVVQLAGDGKYLPTERAVKAESYGAGIESNLVGPEGGQKLVNESVNLINQMFPDK
jgi:hypothetical protein